MIAINFLPHRALRQRQNKRRVEQSLIRLFVSSCILPACALAIMYSHHESYQQRRQLLDLAHQELNQQIAEMTSLRQDIVRLEEQHAQLEQLRQQRNTVVRLLTELAQTVQPGITLNAVEQQMQHISLHGHAASAHELSLFLMRLRQTHSFSKAQLRHTTQSQQPIADMKETGLHSFIISVAPADESTAP